MKQSLIFAAILFCSVSFFGGGNKAPQEQKTCWGKICESRCAAWITAFVEAAQKLAPQIHGDPYAAEGESE